MKAIYTLFACVLLLGLLSCSGDDPTDKDTTAPSTPHLIAHLGDTGDDPVIIDNQQVFLNDEINGIDAVPDGDWIKIPWKPFIDTDLSHVKVYRYTQTEPSPVLVGTVPALDEYYLDQSDLTVRTWYSYFIELYDASGNFSVSDTVSYAILDKCNLYTPSNGDVVSPNNLMLYWNRGDSDTSQFRVLVWTVDDNDNLDLILSHNYNLGQENDPLWIQFPIMTPPLASGTKLRWRVDALDWDDENQKFMGSESEERTFFIQ